MTRKAWNWKDDVQLAAGYREFEQALQAGEPQMDFARLERDIIHAIQMPDMDLEPDVPAPMYQALGDAYGRLEEECAVAHQMVRKLRSQANAARGGYRRRGELIEKWHKRFVAASVTAGVLWIAAGVMALRLAGIL